MEFIRAIFRMLLEGGWIKYRAMFLTLGVVSSLVIGWLDYATTDEINLSFVYLVPIFFTTMAAGRAGGLAMALACAVIKIITDVYSDQPYAQNIYYAFNGLGLFAAFAAFSLLLDALRAAYRRECEVYRKDKLTGLPNRQDFFAVLGEKRLQHRPQGNPLTMLVLDLDDFKKFNTDHGHYIGDIALQTLARSAAKVLGQTGTLYRIGGDDFAVVLPEAHMPEARQTVELLQQRLAATILDKNWRLAVSICVVSCADAVVPLDEILLQASAALRVAKQDGRHGVVVELGC